MLKSNELELLDCLHCKKNSNYGEICGIIEGTLSGWVCSTGVLLPDREYKGGSAMTYGAMQLIPLSSAYLCQDCNCVGNNANQCPACASSALLGLANVLDREPKKEPLAACLPFRAMAA